MADASMVQNLAVAASVFVAVGLIFLYFIWRLRQRRRELSRERLPTRAELDDRAYNQIHIARAGADRVERDGVDVGGVRRLIDDAEASRRKGDSDTAAALAKSAQATLAKLRQQPPVRLPRGPSGASSGSPSEDADPDGPIVPDRPPTASPPADRPSPTPIPRNKAESRFQIVLLEEELARTNAPGRTEAATREASTTLESARSAFDRAEYTEALRLGLRGRRQIGGNLETLPASPAGRREASEGVDTLATSESPEGPATPEEHCPSCGQPLRPNDRFCRGCGLPKTVTRCPSCHEPIAPDDRFCGVCGAPFRV